MTYLQSYRRTLRYGSIVTVVTLLFTCWIGSSSAEEISFNRQVRPILAEFCLECHGPDASHREAELRLDLEVAAKATAINTDLPADSELLHRVETIDAELKMPPSKTGKSLTSDQVNTLRQWILDGARYESHWSLEPIQAPIIPHTKTSVATNIDRLIVTKLEHAGLQLSAPINKPTWLRRATFDLIGLPPTWNEVEAFVNDDSPAAYETVINRLLDSPRYGERWGRHWLDVARYADTHGGSAIGFTEFPFSYTYRDYVIRTFNEDLPYNRFVTEQLAADQLGLEANDPALAALGFLTVGMQHRSRHDLIDDQIDVITRGLMGLTVACARCHDHKFDPIPTADYYSLVATLAGSHAPPVLPIIGEVSNASATRDYQQELARREAVHDDLAREQADVLRGRLRCQIGLYLRELAGGAPEQDTSAAFLSYRTDDIRPKVLNAWRDYLLKMPANDPVFGPWVQLSKLDTSEFKTRCTECVKRLLEENGDPTKFSNVATLGLVPPTWNPRVLQALVSHEPTSLLDVADVYGELFAEVHQQWLGAIAAAALEATHEGTVIADEDDRHALINSAIERQLRHHLYAPGSPTAMTDDVAVTVLNRTVSDSLSSKQTSIHDLHLRSAGSPPRAMALSELTQPATVFVLRRGNPLDRGAEAKAKFLTILSPADATSYQDGKRRLGLARSIVAPHNPLTRRVIVNWVWQHHFGQPLVRTPDDFGTRGRPPAQPELLDFLAAKFLEDGWSIKNLHRTIMLSDVYRQAATENSASRMRDPENELLWRMPQRRLDWEAMRDAMLSVSGELDITIGGRPVDLLQQPVIPRRSVYGFINRDIVSSFISTFDGANPSSCTAKRPETQVPQQTLFALNSEFIQDRAVALADMSARETHDEPTRIAWLYRRVFTREPEADEIRVALDYVQGKSDPMAEPRQPKDAWRQLAHVLLAANEFVFVD